MTLLPWREAVPRTAQQRMERASQLRQLLGAVETWPEDGRFEHRERLAVAELVGGLDPLTAEREVTESLRSEPLGRLP